MQAQFEDIKQLIFDNPTLAFEEEYSSNNYVEKRELLLETIQMKLIDKRVIRRLLYIIIDLSQHTQRLSDSVEYN